MGRLETPEQVLTAQQMRGAEQRLIDAGMPEFDLMKLAASRAAEWVRRLAAGRKVTVLCGPGNNGGDGYVIANCLQQWGLTVDVVAPEPPQSPSAKEALALWGHEVLTSGGAANGEVLVDCLFGSGLSRPLSGAHLLLLRDLVDRHAFTIALDVPSGIASDTGEMLNEKLPSMDVTLALGAWKYAHFSLPGRLRMGAQRLVPIGIDAVEGAALVLDKPTIAAPAGNAHKYIRGLGVVIEGVMSGAARLAAEAAMRAGAGYIKLATDQPTQDANPCMVQDSREIHAILEDTRVDAVLIGPGLGRDGRAREKLAAFLSSGRCGVLDADALHLLKPQMLETGLAAIATPHDGELKSMCRNFSVLAKGRRDRAVTLARTANIVVIAKGPDTVIAAPDGRVVIAPPAPSWLSTAGTGDVLAGIVLSRLSYGGDPFEAACDAVWLHSEGARACGPAFTPLELAEAVPVALARCQ